MKRTNIKPTVSFRMNGNHSNCDQRWIKSKMYKVAKRRSYKSMDHKKIYAT